MHNRIISDNLLNLLLLALAGWGPGVFTAYDHWWVVPVIAGHVGAVAGAWMYFILVEMNSSEGEAEAVEPTNRKTEISLPRMVMTGPGTNYLQVSRYTGTIWTTRYSFSVCQYLPPE